MAQDFDGAQPKQETGEAGDRQRAETMSADGDRAAPGGLGGILGGAIVDRIEDGLDKAGIDPVQVLDTAQARVSDLQTMLLDEIRARPLRAVGWAAAAGVLVGLMSAR